MPLFLSRPGPSSGWGIAVSIKENPEPLKLPSWTTVNTSDTHTYSTSELEEEEDDIQESENDEPSADTTSRSSFFTSAKYLDHLSRVQAILADAASPRFRHLQEEGDLNLESMFHGEKKLRLGQDQEKILHRWMAKHQARTMLGHEAEFDRLLQSLSFKDPDLDAPLQAKLHHKVRVRLTTTSKTMEKAGCFVIVQKRRAKVKEIVRFADWTRLWDLESWDGDIHKPGNWDAELEDGSTAVQDEPASKITLEAKTKLRKSIGVTRKRKSEREQKAEEDKASGEEVQQPMAKKPKRAKSKTASS